MPEVKKAGNRVVRPALSVLLVSLAGIWAGIYSAESLIWQDISLSQPIAIIVMLASVMLIITVLLKRARILTRAIVLSVTSLCLGLSVGMLYWTGIDNSIRGLTDEYPSGMVRDCSIRIIEDEKQGALSKTSLAVVKLPNSSELRIRIFWNASQDPLPLGCCFQADISFRALNRQQAFLHQKGIAGSATVSNLRESGFENSVLGKIYEFREHNRRLLMERAGEGAALLRGVLLGDTTGLDVSDAGKAYKTTGLSHLIAVSGSHLVVIAVLISWVIRKLNMRRPLEIILISTLLISYVVLTALQPSAIRSCVMTIIISISPLLGRRGHVTSALTVAGILMMLLFPPTAFSAGFWMSMFAVFGLAVFYPLILSYISCLIPLKQGIGNGKFRKGLKTAIIEPLSLTVTAQLVTVSITAPLFSMISVVSPLANILVTPLVTILVGGGITTFCLMPILGASGPIILSALCMIADLSITLARFCASIPFACLPAALDLTTSVLLFLVVAAIVYLLWPQPSTKRARIVLLSLLMASTLLFASALLPVRPQLVLLDVGQGDAILIRDGRTNLLIDTGKSENLLLKALARQRVDHLDAVIITHLDDDHGGALSALEGTVRVDAVLFAAGLIDSKAEDPILQSAGSLLGKKELGSLEKGDRIYLASHVSLLMIWPDRTVYKGSNEESVCLLLLYDADGDGAPELVVLLAGDAESKTLEQALRNTEFAQIDVIKIGHHGSKSSINELQLDNMGCRVALISVGRDNRYGHPSAQIIGYLESRDITIYRTDLNGDIRVVFRGLRVLVYCDTMGNELDTT